MSYQLWVSRLTGYRRKGTRFSTLKDIFIDNVTAKTIFEPLLCCPADSRAEEAKDALKNREFDVAGVKKTEDGDVIGYVVTDELTYGDLSKFIKKIDAGLLISDSTPIAKILSILTNRNFAFVIYGNHITGIVTRADINKPPMRIYIFGIISLFEMHLNFWITHSYSDNSWINILPKQRLEKAKEIYELRKGNNQDLSLLECLELCDKRDILAKSKEFRDEFDMSKNSFDSFVKGIEKIRNELAHNQNSIISNIEWAEFIKIISDTEEFLTKSDNKVEAIALQGNDFKDLLIPSI